MGSEKGKNIHTELTKRGETPFFLLGSTSGREVLRGVPDWSEELWGEMHLRLFGQNNNIYVKIVM